MCRVNHGNFAPRRDRSVPLDYSFSPFVRRRGTSAAAAIIARRVDAILDTVPPIFPPPSPVLSSSSRHRRTGELAFVPALALRFDRARLARAPINATLNRRDALRGCKN